MSPSSNDPVTIPCPVCATHFTPAGKRLYCSNTCRVAGHRRRHRSQQATTPVVLPPEPKSRRAHTVYECENCDTRKLGEQRCDCGLFMRRLGPGGTCPTCDEIHTINELLDQ